MLSLDINPLKFAITAQELRESLSLIPLLITPDCDIIEPVKNVAASEDSI
jgi:hypothetical protein